MSEAKLDLILAHLAELNAGQAELREGQAGIIHGLDRLEAAQADLPRRQERTETKLDRMAEDVRGMHVRANAADQDALSLRTLYIEVRQRQEAFDARLTLIETRLELRDHS